MIKSLSDNHLFNNYPCEAEDAEIKSLRQQLASRDAEIAELKRAIKFQASGNYDYQEELKEERAELRQHLEVKQATLLRAIEGQEAAEKKLLYALAACKLKDDALKATFTCPIYIPMAIAHGAEEALAIQPDNSALQQFAAKVREQCEQAAQPEDSYHDDWFLAKTDAVARIRAIKELPK